MAAAAPYNVAAMAALFDLTERRIQQLASDGIIPKATRGNYELIGSVQGYIRFLRNAVEKQGSGSSNEDLKTKRGTYLDIRSKSEELDYLKKSGQLLDKDDVQAVLNEAMSIIGTGLDGLGGRLAGDLSGDTDPASIRLKILSETRRIRAQAADRLASLGAIANGSGNPKTAAGPKRRPVGKRKPRATARKPGAGTVSKRTNAVHNPDPSGGNKPEI